MRIEDFQLRRAAMARLRREIAEEEMFFMPGAADAARGIVQKMNRLEIGGREYRSTDGATGTGAGRFVSAAGKRAACGSGRRAECRASGLKYANISRGKRAFPGEMELCSGAQMRRNFRRCDKGKIASSSDRQRDAARPFCRPDFLHRSEAHVILAGNRFSPGKMEKLERERAKGGHLRT